MFIQHINYKQFVLSKVTCPSLDFATMFALCTKVLISIITMSIYFKIMKIICKPSLNEIAKLSKKSVFIILYTIRKIHYKVYKFDYFIRAMTIVILSINMCACDKR